MTVHEIPFLLIERMDRGEERREVIVRKKGTLHQNHPEILVMLSESIGIVSLVMSASVVTQ